MLPRVRPEGTPQADAHLAPNYTNQDRLPTPRARATEGTLFTQTNVEEEQVSQTGDSALQEKKGAKWCNHNRKVANVHNRKFHDVHLNL
ncbi:hypothetical protein AVEN_208507-1 [Araneus ventricosus]|uniref:Uncharacterized protein n=1 Tax=Araneus ventricosus TaxID=182803 RepID=A0A4Y2E3W9_ARAVE|nr:hypothetical protein AVEN_208507-1 [Araneus ventricosus]